MGSARLKVAWISFFPLEWLPDIPEPLTKLSRPHPASWQRVLLEELQTRPELELHVVYVRRHFERSFSFERQGVWFHCLKVPRGMRELSLFWWETFLIRRCLRRVQPDLVQAWGTDRGAAMVATRLGYPCLVTMQGLINWIAESVPLNAAQKVQAWLEKVSLRRARLATAESAFAVRWLRQHYPNLEVLQVEHAPGWIFHRVERRPELKPLRLLFVGVPGLLKGTDLLVRALDALRAELDFRLTLVGPLESAMKQQLQAATSSALWERVELRQDLSPAEVAAEMARAALLVFPTRVDNSPNAVKEAVVTGVPVVASAVGGIVDYVIPGQNGLTFAPGDLSQLVQTIRAAAGHPQFSKGQVDPATLRQMREYLSPATMRDKFLAAYQRALEV